MARDAYGNQKQRGGDVFELGVMGPANLRGLQDKGDGTYTCLVDAQNPLESEGISAASLLISVTLYGKHVSGSPFRPQIIPAATDGPGEYQRSKTLQDLAVSQPPYSSASTAAAASGSVDARKAVRQSYSSAPAGLSSSLLSPGSPSSYTGNGNGSRNADNTRSGSISQPKPAPHGGAGVTSSMGATSNSPRKGSAASNQPPPQTNTSSLSRLEAARQRALQGVISTANATPSAEGAAAGGYSGGRDPSSNSSRGMSTPSDLSGRLSKLEVMTRQVGSSAPGAGAASRKNFQTPKDMDGGFMPPPPPPDSPPGEEEQWSALNYGNNNNSSRSTVDLVVLQDSLAQGILGPLPARSTSEEQRLLAVVSDAIRNREVSRLISFHGEQLSNVYNFYYDVQEEGVALNSSKWGRGIYKMLEDYDVVPSYCSKKDVKTIFGLVIYAEMPASAARGHMNFVSFVKLLATIAIFSLSNPPLATLYQTPKSKIEVMLSKWGFAEEAKLRTIQKKHSK